MGNLVDKISQVENLDEQIRDYLLPRMIQLVKTGILNDGKYPKRKKDCDIFSIKEYHLTNNGNIYAAADIHWAGDVYDDCSVSMTWEQWEQIAITGE